MVDESEEARGGHDALEGGGWESGVPYARDTVKREGCTFGEHTYGTPSLHGEGGTLTIGRYCSIAEDVHIHMATDHHTDWVTTYPFPQLSRLADVWPSALDIPLVHSDKGGIHIGNDVWIGMGVHILPGVTVGDGAVLAVGAIITRDVEPYAVAAGVPARRVKWRFDEGRRQRLLRLHWWDWPDELVTEALPLLNSPDIEAFLEWAERCVGQSTLAEQSQIPVRGTD